MSSTSTGTTGGNAGRRTREPEDARRGHIAPTPSDADEARADRELAEAERAAVMGTASSETTDRLAALEGARTHEERRRRWQEG